MNNQKKIGIAIFTVLAIGVAGYFGYQHFSSLLNGQDVKAATASVEKIGVLESMRAIKAHPRYAEIEAIEREMEELQQDMQQKMERGMAMMMPSDLRMEVSNRMTAGEQALRTEANQKIAAKETEINKRLAEIDLAKRQAANMEMETYRRQINDEYEMKIFNLKMKLEALDMSDELYASMEKDMESLKQEKEFKLEGKYLSLLEKISKEYQAEKQAGEKEIQAYIQQLREEYGLLTLPKSGQPNDEMMAKVQKMNQQLNAEIKAAQEAYAEKKQKREEIKSAIISDIKMKVADIAREQEITVVLGDVRTNAAGIDITDAVIEACKEHWQQ